MVEKEKSGAATKKMLVLVAALVILALALFNAAIFAGFLKPASASVQYSNFAYDVQSSNGSLKVGFASAFIVGEHDPVAELRTAVSANKTVIVAEGDASPTQTTAFIGMALAQLAANFALKSPDIYGIGFENGTAVSCTNGTIEFCQALRPAEGETLIVLKYPSYAKNEIIVSKNVIEIRARSGGEELALVYLLEDVVK